MPAAQVPKISLDVAVELFISPISLSNLKGSRFFKDPSELGLKYEENILGTIDGINLSSWYIPSRSDKAIVLCHEHGGDKSHMLKYAKFLNTAGFNIIMFDFRAHGSSSGEYFTHGYWECDDISAVVDNLVSRGIYNIGVLGVSSGAAISVLSSSDKRIRALVVDSIYPSIEFMLRKWIDVEGFEVEDDYIDNILYRASVLTGADFSSLDPIDSIKKTDIPIMFAHGSRDRLVPIDEAVKIYAKANDPKEFLEVRGLHNHYLLNGINLQYESAVSRFFYENLR